MNKRVLKTLEYDKIKQAMMGRAVSAIGHEMIMNLEPSTKTDEIQDLIDETQDGADILRLKGGIPIPKMENIRPHLKRLEIGALLNGAELAQLGRVLRAASEVVRFLDELKDNEVELRRAYELGGEIVTLPDLNRQLRRSLEDDGRVTDEASIELSRIRHGIAQLEGQIRSKMDAYTKGSSAKFLSDPIITIRNDRYVIPVKQEYRGHFGGVVHDQSASGQTLFIEPQAVMDLNNRLRQQQIAETREIERILADLSNQVAPYSNEIMKNAEILGHFDFINAKAAYAHEIKATEPLINVDNQVNLRQARHPMIDQKKVVANDIVIGKDYKAMVITGPNTGGKSVSLKTLGLLQLMAQSGLFIPALEASEIGIFDNIFADIGDEQSIEQNLSTFSSHMDNIVKILDIADSKSLVLLDELGAGTDPQEGAALAIAILDKLGAMDTTVVATTHYPELKVYGYNRAGTINASMEFDSDTLQPTYRLLIGIPGRSNAFDISLRLGLEPEIVDQAKALIDDESQDLNNMISDLENQRKAAETEYLETRRLLDEATNIHADLQTAYDDFFKEREEQMDKAKEKANKIVDQATEKSEDIIAELRRLQMNQQTGIKEHQFIDAKTGLEKLHQNTGLKKNRVLNREKRRQQVKVGDDVLVKSYGQQGVIMSKLDDEHFEVQMGIIKMKVAANDLVKQDIKQEQKQMRGTSTLRSASTSHVNPQLDLRGMRYEAAMAEVDQYIDGALLAGYPQVTIVHGKGTGAIREGVQEYLRSNRQVKSFAYAPANSGGNGATIVTFK